MYICQENIALDGGLKMRKTQPLFQVAALGCPSAAPKEPYMIVTHHTAQASAVYSPVVDGAHDDTIHEQAQPDRYDLEVGARSLLHSTN